MERVPFFLFMGLTVIVVSATPEGVAKTVYVDANATGDGSGSDWANAAKTITVGLTLAASGDEVWVKSATYEEAISLKSAIGLYGGFPSGGMPVFDDRDPGAHPTAIDATGLNSGVVEAVRVDGATIDGFIITGGMAGLGGGGGGGGIYGTLCSFEIRKCTITGNVGGWGYGGGVFLIGESSPVFIECTIRGNTVYTRGGGGVYVWDGRPRFERCIFESNEAERGGALHLGRSNAEIVNCIITRNSTRRGGTVQCDGGAPTLVNCLIIDNSAPSGGAFHCGGGTPTLVNCTIADNDGMLGPAVQVEDGATPSMINCILRNVGTEIGGVSASAARVEYSCVQGGRPGVGNIDASPLFVDRESRDYRLQDGSPCVDSGINSATASVDPDGNPRPGADGLTDMGAYEAPPEYTGGPGEHVPRILHVRADAAEGGDGNTWTSAFRSITAAMRIVNTSDEIWVAGGTYHESVWMEPTTMLYGGFAEDEKRREARDWIANPTIIDATGLESSAVIASTGTHIDGFTITGGDAYAGGGICCVDCSPEIGNCIIAGNRSEVTGGGVHCSGGSPNLVDCVIEANTSIRGGGIYCRESSPTLVRCVIEGNRGHYYGGGVFCIDGSSPVLRDCTIRQNAAMGLSGAGGGLYSVESSTTLVRCTIEANSAVYSGGGLSFSTGGALLLSDCTIRRNSTGWQGGGITAFDGSARFERCIFESNEAPAKAGALNLDRNDTEIVNCLFSGNSSDQGGAVECAAGAVRLVHCTLADNMASSGSAIHAEEDAIVEVTNCLLWNLGSEIAGPSADDATVAYSCLQGGWSGEGNINGRPQFADWENGDYHLQNGSPGIDGGTVIATVSVDLDGNPRPRADGVTDMGAYESPPGFTGGAGAHVPGIIYVRADAPDGGDGTTWTTAFRTIAAAVRVANTSDEIWVAGGTYGELVRVEPTTSLYGGFAGVEISREDRDWSANTTIIDATGLGRGAVSMAAGTTVDGFTVTGGKAYLGGGIFCDFSSPEIRNCSIVENRSERDGGGLYFCGGSPSLVGCLIEGNTSDEGGGVYCTDDCSADFTECTIRGNSARIGGGGVEIRDSSLTFVRCLIEANRTPQTGGGIICIRGDGPQTFSECTIRGNRAANGGGIDADHAEVRFDRCVFESNEASKRGGALNFWMTDGEITNCLFTGNSAERGGAVEGYFDLTNCTLVKNEADSGSGVYGFGSLTNCVLWNRGDDIGTSTVESVSVRYSCVQGGWPGEGNIDARPVFVDWEGGDYRLQNGSPGVDAGSLSAGVTVDLDGNPRPGADGLVDMGAYESPPEYEGGPGGHVPGVLHVRSDAPGGGDGSSWDSAYRTLGTALHFAGDSDEIWVAGGVYPEAVVLEPGIPVYGGFVGVETSRDERDWALNTTVIDATGLDRSAVIAADGALLDGFTITGGNGGYGGGVVCYKVSMDFANCLITGNRAIRGGGIFSQHSPTPIHLLNCRITGNVTTFHEGGGLYLQGASLVELRDCLVSENTASTEGGGIASYSSDLELTECSVVGNAAGESGGGIYATGTDTPWIALSLNIADCTIADNTAASSVGGIRIAGYVFVRMTNTLIVRNRAWVVGGVFSYGGSVLLTNCSLVDNSPGACGLLLGSGPLEPPIPRIRNSIIWNRAVSEVEEIWGDIDIQYSCLKGGWPGEGNIRRKPVFVDADGGDYRLADGSPGIDGGRVSDAPDADIDGRPRPGDDGLVDMGAYESPPEYVEHIPQSSRVFHVRWDAPEGGDGSSWDSAFRRINSALDVARASDEIWVASGSYNERLLVNPDVSLFGGFQGLELEREERNCLAHQTIIDASGLYQISEAVALLGDAVFDGFTVKRAPAGILCSTGSPQVQNCTVVENGARYPFHGGVYCQYSSPTISNCTITDNESRGLGCSFSSPTLISCLVTENHGGYGGGVSADDSDVTFLSCIIADNIADSVGGAVAADYESRFAFVNCTITRNGAPEVGGLCTSPFEMQNSILRGNSDLEMAVAAANSEITWSNIEGGFSGPGNIDADPLFVDPWNGNYRLAAGSPCIDAGSNQLTAGVLTDLDGNVRIWDGDDVPGAVVDMGAYELGSTPPMLPGDTDGNGVVNMLDLFFFSRWWQQPANETNYGCDRACDGSIDENDLWRLIHLWK